MNCLSTERRLVCLVIPPSAFLLDERVFMNLGILKVAAALEGVGHTVELVDLSGVANYVDAIRDHAARTNANVFGITATTPQMPTAARIAGAIRDVRPDAKLVIGGPHVTVVNAARRNEEAQGRRGRAAKAFGRLSEFFDVVIAGDGEDSMCEALANDAVKFLDADDPQSRWFLNNARLAELPFPARHLVDVDSYHYSIDDVRALSLIAQLGCPFACGFCGGRESPSFRRVRIRAPGNVVEEITHLYRTYGVRGFMLYDDELNVNPRMIELMNGIASAQERLGVEFRLRGFIKSQLFTNAQAQAMYRAGFRWILVGFESGSPRILKNINKKATKQENTRCVDIARRHSLKVKALMSIGHPGESEETVADTHRWLLEVRPDDFDVTIITTYPGTPYYDHALRHETERNVWVYSYNGDKLYSYEVDYIEVADYYKGDPDGGYHAYVYTDYLTPDTLVALRDMVERDVRAKLGIKFNLAAPAIRYEHSMGQFGGRLPANILRTSGGRVRSEV